MVQEDITWNRLANLTGKFDRNIGIDLMVEFQNNGFKSKYFLKQQPLFIYKVYLFCLKKGGALLPPPLHEFFICYKNYFQAVCEIQMAVTLNNTL